MSWLPDFDFGLWNAWILMLYYPFHPLIMYVVDKAVGTGEMSEKMGNVPYTKQAQRMLYITMTIALLLFIYSIFLPLKIGTVWFYVGLIIYLVGLVMFLTAIVNIATTPLGEPFTKGMYKYSRHPMTVSSSITFIGISIACVSWVFLLFSILIIVVNAFLAISEEQSCLEAYGDEYQKYLDQTSRWIGL